MHTSDPVNIAGSFSTNCEVVMGLADSFVNIFFTCSTTSSCFTAPEAEITWIKQSSKISCVNSNVYTVTIILWQNNISNSYKVYILVKYHSVSSIVGWNIIFDILLCYLHNVFSRSKNSPTKRSVLERSSMQMVKNNFLCLCTHLKQNLYIYYEDLLLSFCSNLQMK